MVFRVCKFLVENILFAPILHSDPSVVQQTHKLFFSHMDKHLGMHKCMFRTFQIPRQLALKRACRSCDHPGNILHNYKTVLDYLRHVYFQNTHIGNMAESADMNLVSSVELYGRTLGSVCGIIYISTLLGLYVELYWSTLGYVCVQ